MLIRSSIRDCIPEPSLGRSFSISWNRPQFIQSVLFRASVSGPPATKTFAPFGFQRDPSRQRSRTPDLHLYTTPAPVLTQYDISDTANPKLVGQVFVGGSIAKGGTVKVVGEEQPTVPTVKVSIGVIFLVPTCWSVS